jgi:glycosyltransferase involved in cell wall biosynthesis
MEYFTSNRMVTKERAKLIPGSGVDINTFQAWPEEQNPLPVVVLPSRLIWEKGVREFVQAAALVNKDQQRARFILVGASDPGNPSAIPNSVLEKWVEDGLVEWRGWQNDMPSVYRAANVVCLPSFYGEGLSKTLLEASASGRAIVTTNVPGCRDAIEENETGLLVPPRDAAALAAAITELITSPGLRLEMGRKGRRRVERFFSTEVINSATIELYDQLLSRNSLS